MSQHLSFLGYGKATGGDAGVRTGLGKSDRPGSQGGLRKHGSWWNYEPAAHIERVRDSETLHRTLRAPHFYPDHSY